MTKNRQMILDLIRSTPRHMSADEIYMEVRKVHPGIVVATVYNNLNALTEERLIKRISLFDGPDRYDRNMIPHEHLICDHCGQVYDAGLPDFAELLSKQLGIPISSYELNIHGICKNCAE